MKKATSLGSCLGCSLLVAAAFACVGVFRFGGSSLTVSAIAFTVGAFVGWLLGGGIGIASRGKADNGSLVVALVFGIISVLIVNNSVWIANGWWQNVNTVKSDNAPPPVPTPAQSVGGTAQNPLTFDDIDTQLRELRGAERDKYKRSLIGQTIRLRAAISAVRYDGLHLSVGQDTLTTRIEVDAKIWKTVPARDGGLGSTELIYQEGDFVTVTGKIYEINELFGLLIRITDAQIEHNK